MAEKKVISIEDRIPKLKEVRKKKTNRRLIFYLSLFFILISIVVYLQSPLSHIQAIKIEGNDYINSDELIALSGLSKDNNFWGVSTGKIEDKITEHQEIKNATVSRKLPNTIVIAVEELKKVAYLKREGKYYPVLENGNFLETPTTAWRSDAPLLMDFTSDAPLEALASELQALPSSISSLISEIYWKPTDTNSYKVTIFMNDGYEVRSSIHNFSNYMKTYPSIVSQLDKKQLGIITIGEGGAVFDPYEKEQKTKEEDHAS
ncbi:cell division protein DivIB [Paraliobacillus ryukyuensis]|uniref:Cell division protein DivIB n=1 Tax=Paraliobacillus ryukyuensis TaxID=200904 RepID=A0A366EHQ9_9BACI|nr:FtsQ-type POTRA domain-containing protein [Paraliobacillus ryukyuensis]RBP01888.1 cell division protein FtsQ [Paraliobacillus ryukyuensis]